MPRFSIRQYLSLATVTAVTTLLGGCGGGTPSAPPAQQAATYGNATATQIDHYVTAQMQRQHLPGLSLVIAQDGVPLYQHGYGLADVDGGRPVTPQTVFRIGSVTKQFTASAIVLLQQDGKLRLDQTLAHYFPTAPAPWQAITIGQLLHHTAGLRRDFQQELADVYDPGHAYTADELVSLTGSLPMVAAPGRLHSYSNLGYFLLGLLVERVSGQSYGDFLRTRLFGPLDMGTAGLISNAPDGTRAYGYHWDNGRYVHEDTVYPGDAGGAGGLQMSAPDLARWDAALYRDSPLTAASRAQLWQPAVLNDGSTVPYGLGWELDTINGHPYSWHNGKVAGFHSQFARYTDSGLSVIVFCNNEDGMPERIAAGIAALVNPALDWQLAADPQPAVGALARSVVDDLLQGRFTAQRYTAAEATRLQQGSYQAYVDYAARLGALKAFGYVDSADIAGVRTYRYLLRTADDEVQLWLQLDGTGKISLLAFN